jgi:Tfp pilus assembly protein PilO
VTGKLAKIRKRFTVALTILVIADVALLAFLLWPGSSASAQRTQEEALQQQSRTLAAEVAPLRGMDQKLVQTRADVKSLYQERIPAHWSVVSQELERLTRDTGVTTRAIKYNPVKSEKGGLPDVQSIEIDTSITGEYSKVARFINAIEQDKLLFIISQISLTGEEGGQVTLQIKFQTFIKEPSATSGA